MGKLTKDKCASKSHQIAQALGEGWYVAEVSEGWGVWVSLHNTQAPDLGMQFAFSDEKIEVTGEYIKGWHDAFRNDAPKIGCSVDRAPGSIAGDIARRFLPDYLAIIAQEQQKRDYWGEVERHKGTLLDALYCPIGLGYDAVTGKAEFGRKHADRAWWFEADVYDWRPYGTDVFTASLDTMRVEIKVVLPARKAQEIMKLLKQWEDENE